MEQENFNCLSAFNKSSFVFPTEFPYEFDSFACSPASLSSPDESVVSSTETESSDEDDFFAGLTRRLTQQLAVKPEKWVMAESPQSTLSGSGSWSISSSGSPNGALSPPTTPFGLKNDTWDLVYAVGGQASRLRTSNEDNKCNTYKQRSSPFPCMNKYQEIRLGNQTDSGPYSSRNLGLSMSQKNMDYCQVREEHTLKQQCTSVGKTHQQVKMAYQAWPIQDHHQQIQSRGRSGFGCEDGVRIVRPLGLNQSAWPRVQLQSNQYQNHHQHQYPHLSGPGMRYVSLGESSVLKKECAGTGVFLPRRYGGPSDSRRKTGCSTVLLPAKVVQALNFNLEDKKNMNGHLQPRLNSDFVSDYDVLMARRKYAIMAQQKRNLGLNHEVQLPREWTY